MLCHLVVKHLAVKHLAVEHLAVELVNTTVDPWRYRR